MKYKTIILILVLLSFFSRASATKSAILDSAMMRMTHSQIESLYLKGNLGPLELAELALRLGRADEAERHILKFFDSLGHNAVFPSRAGAVFYKISLQQLNQNAAKALKEKRFDWSRNKSDDILYRAYIDYSFNHIQPLEQFEKIIALPQSRLERKTDRLDALRLLAECSAACGKLDKARKTYRLYTSEVDSLCTSSSLYSVCRHSLLAYISMKEGNYKAAAAAIDKAESHIRQYNPLLDSELAAIQRMRADIALLAGNQTEAEHALRKASALYKNCGLNCPALLSEAKIAEVLIMKGQYKEAGFLIDSLSDLEWPKSIGAAKGFIDLMANNSELSLLDKQPGPAQLLYGGVVDLHKTMEQSDLETTLRLLAGAGYACIKNDKANDAISYFSEQLELERKMAHDQFVFMPESKRGAYWAHADTRMRRLFNVNREGTVTMDGGKVIEMPGLNKNTSAELLYDAALFHKGLLLESSAVLRKALGENGDPATIQAASRLTALREIIASQPNPDANMAAVADSLEQALLESTPGLIDFMSFTDIRWPKVKEALKPGELAVEFISSTDDGTDYYSAELLRHDWDSPRHVFLFFTKEGKSPFDKSETYSRTDIYRKVWRKIMPYLNENDHIYFSPAGCLHNTAIEYALLPDSTRFDSHYTAERLSSTRNLARQRNPKSILLASVYGGLNYNTDIEEQEIYATEATELLAAMRGADRTGLGQLFWNYLPGTLAEANAVSKAMTDAGYKVALFEGDTGVEESFKRLPEVKPTLIHIATHGFFNPTPPNRQDFIASRYEDDDATLYRCGLVMSGANTASNEHGDDGILTAKEISALDLNDTDLVVMSACSTALGKISGDGVFGLQRAFKLAGAGTIMMSLWPVHDGATNLLMTEFYKALTAGKTKRAALSAAQQAVRGATFETDGTIRSGADPFFWAAFILLD